MLGLQKPAAEEQPQEPQPQPQPQPPPPPLSQLSQPAVTASQSPGGIRRPDDVSLCSRSSTQVGHLSMCPVTGQNDHCPEDGSLEYLYNVFL